MLTSVKISISLPGEILARADRERNETGENRSELFRRALETLLREKRRQTAVGRYVEGYVAEPESAYEVASAESASSAVWKEEGWD